MGRRARVVDGDLVEPGLPARLMTGDGVVSLLVNSASLFADEEKILEAFRSGEGMGWHEHDQRLFRGTERFFRPGYRMHLVGSWIPALEGVQEKLEAGASVADVGCGHGASTIIMAEAQERVVGFVTVDPESLDLDQIVVATEAWGTGVASALLAEAKRVSPRGLDLHVNSDNSRAIRFYEKQGFTLCAEVMNWRSGAQDELEAVDRQRIAA